METVSVPLRKRSYCDRAILEDRLLHQPDNALTDYNEAIRLAPGFERACFDRGAHFRGRHNYQRAIADFTHAIELMPSDFSAYAQRAYASARQGDRARALAQRSPQNPCLRRASFGRVQFLQCDALSPR